MLKVSSINGDDGFTKYRDGVPKGEDACSAADNNQQVPGAASAADVRDYCASGSKFQTLQWVFFGLSAVSIGAGSYLLATEQPSDEQPPSAARLQIVPSAGRDGGGVDVRLVF
jgi:hypothetical protein